MLRSTFELPQEPMRFVLEHQTGSVEVMFSSVCKCE